jgi:hypothetical protein
MENMMKQKLPIRILVLAFGLLAGLTASAQENTAPETVDGLHLVPDTKLGLVYAGPEVDLSVYHNLLLMDAQVAFKKNWRRDINQEKPYHVTAADMQNIKSEVTALFREIFTGNWNQPDSFWSRNNPLKP